MAVSKKESMMVNEEEMEDDSDMGDDVSDSELEQESEGESEEEGDVRLAEPSQNATYNKDGLLEKLADMSWPEHAKWIDKLTLDIDQEQPVDVNDDLTRELAFYTQALNGTRMAFEKLQGMGLPFLRPEDYYAEMVKSDSHMEKVKSRLLVEKKNMEEAEERRKAREAKKLSKEIQNQKLKERAKQKKESIESVKKWRKQRQQSGFAGGDKGSELDSAFEDGKPFEKSSKKRPGVAPGDRSGGKAKYAGKGKKPKKREVKDSKFGFGGRKGSRKQNVAETTNDLRGFNKQEVSLPISTTMLVSTLDLLTQAASNSLYVFCFCNLIIVMIVVGSKPGSYFDQESELSLSKVTHTTTNDKQVDHDAKCEQKGTISSSVVRNEVSNVKTELASNEKVVIADQIVDNKECDNDDELRRRSEEFIEKATSNSLFIFCFCNLIIAIIVLGSKSISDDHVESAIHIRMSTNKHDQEDEQGTSAKQVGEERQESNALMQVSQESKANNAVTDDCTVSKTKYGNGNDETEAGDDELRTRVEEFIQKVNKAWNAEFLRTTCVF
ncbi:hypothetical protein ACLB2K_071200 [Fragaria x ananassa]